MKREVKQARASLFWGIGLLLIGILLLLQSLGVLPPSMDVLWPALFAIGGITFVSIYVANRQRWWGLIAGGALLGIAAAAAWAYLFPGRGTLTGLSFWWFWEPALCWSLSCTARIGGR